MMKKSRAFLGIHEGHNASVCVLKEVNNQIEMYSFEAERLDRIKYSVWCDRFPGESFTNIEKRKWIVDHVKNMDELILYALEQAEVQIEDVNDIICTQGTNYNRLPKWIIEKGYCEASHHLSHAASAYYSSGYKESLIIVCDGVGDLYEDGWEVQSVWRGIDNNIFNISSTRKRNRFDMGIGNVYQLITYYLGFGFGGCGTTMALAAFGNKDDEYSRKLFVKEKNGDVLLNPELIDPASYLESVAFKKGEYPIFDLEYEKALRQVPSPSFFCKREPTENPLQKKFSDLAATVQFATEEAVFHIIDTFMRTTDHNLCMAGGVFLNCKMNAKIRKKYNFDGFFIPTAPGDGGLALGAVQFLYHSIYNNDTKWNYTPYIGTLMQHPHRIPKDIEVIKYSEEIYDVTARMIADGKIVAWCDGRAESGPRALGNRSLLASPSNSNVPDTINNRIKHREPFRPFAPAIIEEQFYNWFEGDMPIEYMLEVRNVLEEKRAIVPGIVHFDGTARVQIVSKKNNNHFYSLIEAFFKLTGIPIMINTSLNRKGEPIVDSSEDALGLLQRGLIDALVISDTVYLKL